MPLEIIRNDITKVHVDAIVNAANRSLLGGGGVDGAIHKAAGVELLEECKSLGGCKIGEAKITGGYNLPAKYVIHTVGPKWQGGQEDEEKLLNDCYTSSLELAKKHNLESIAFPLISSGSFGYPKDKALSTAISAIGSFLMENDMMVYLVVYDKRAFQLSEKLFHSIEEYIDDMYIQEHRLYRNVLQEDAMLREYNFEEAVSFERPIKKTKRSLENVVKNRDETFSQMLLRLIDEKGMTDSQVYKRANVDRRHFSKIRNDMDYKPSKVTALAFAIALELNLDQTKDLLLSAGYALSHSYKFDLIIEFFIQEKNYNIFEINEALFAFDQATLGV
ncbi:macro domain-containing protein [Gudongella sp. SC589]|uniref:macro domain-containing protein n=1 Tax=Gudongella sp. SC589 TaxID=3385990 RepID=UPI0039047A1C